MLTSVICNKCCVLIVFGDICGFLVIIIAFAVILSPFPLHTPSPTTLRRTFHVFSFPIEDHFVGISTLNHNVRATAKPMIGARQRRVSLSSCSPLPVPCSTKTSYPASHAHNTTPLHATTPHSHLPLYSHPKKGRGKKGICIYKIYRWPPPVCGVVSLRQHALLLCACAFYTCTYPRTPTHIYKRILS